VLVTVEPGEAIVLG